MSSQKTSFVKQAAILALAGLLVRFIGFLYRLPLTDLLGDQGNGIYGKAYTIYTFLLILSSAGLPAAISKMVSERVARKQYAAAHQVFLSSLLLSGITGLAAALILGFGAERLAIAVDTPGSKYAMLTLAPTVFIVGIMSSFRGYFQGMRNTVPTALSQVAEQLFNAGFSVYLAYVLIRNGVEMGAAGGTAGTGIGAFMGLVVVWGIYLMARPAFRRRIRRDTSRPEPRSQIAKELVFTALPIIAGTAIFSLTNIIDMKMVSSRLMAAGVYSMDQIDSLYGQLTGKYVVITTLPVSIATALATAVVPNIAASKVSQSRAQLHDKMNAALKLTMLISIPAAMGIGVLGTPILQMLFPRHSSGGMLLTVGALSIVFLALAQIATGMLQGVGEVKVPAFAAFFGGLVKVPINYFLISIPAINVLGAVISTTVCYFVAAVIDVFVLLRVTGFKPDWSAIFVKPVAASVVMGFVCYVAYYVVYMLLPSNTAACLAAIFIGALVYFVYMVFLRGITAEDLDSIPGGGKLARRLNNMGIL